MRAMGVLSGLVVDLPGCEVGCSEMMAVPPPASRGSSVVTVLCATRSRSSRQTIHWSAMLKVWDGELTSRASKGSHKNDLMWCWIAGY